MKQSAVLKLLGALTATISISVSLFTAYWVNEKMTSEALSSMRRVTVVLAEQTYSAFEVIDSGMVRSVKEIEHRFPRWMDTDPRTLHDILAHDKVSMPQVRYLLTANDKAVVTALSHMDTLPDIHVDDRAYFAAHARTALKTATGLYIGTAIIGRTTGEHVIPLSRRLDIDGYFAGVLMAALDANYFQRLYAKLYVPEHGAVYVTKANKEVLAIYPDNTPIPSGPEYLSFNAPVADYDLTVGMSVSMESIREPWRPVVLVVVLSSLLSSIGILVLVIFCTVNLEKYEHWDGLREKAAWKPSVISGGKND